MNKLEHLIKEAKKVKEEKKLEYEKAKYHYETLLGSLDVSNDGTESETNMSNGFKRFMSTNHVDIAELGVDISPKKSFPDIVEELISKFGDQEFLVVHIEKLLEEAGKLPSGKTSPRAKIATVLTKLNKKGVIEIVHKGSGSEPNRYILKKFAPYKISLN